MYPLKKIVVFETGSHYVALAALFLLCRPDWPPVQSCGCLCLPNPGSKERTATLGWKRNALILKCMCVTRVQVCNTWTARAQLASFLLVLRHGFSETRGFINLAMQSGE